MTQSLNRQTSNNHPDTYVRLKRRAVNRSHLSKIGVCKWHAHQMSIHSRHVSIIDKMFMLGSPSEGSMASAFFSSSKGGAGLFIKTPVTLPCLIHSYQHISITAVMRMIHHPHNFWSAVVLR